MPRHCVAAFFDTKSGVCYTSNRLPNGKGLGRGLGQGLGKGTLNLHDPFI